MASRYPSSPDDSRTYQSAYAYTNYHSKSNYIPRSTAASRPPPRSPHTPPPPVTQRPNRYYSPRTYTNSSSHTVDRPSPDHTRSYNNNSNHLSQRNRPENYSSLRPQQDRTRGTDKSPRGGQQTPRAFEYRYDPHRSHDRTSQSYRDQASYHPSQPRQEPRSTSQYKRAHKSGSGASPYIAPPTTERSPAASTSNHRKRDPVSSQGTTRKPHTATSSAPKPARKEDNKTTKAKDQCSICLNEMRDQVSLKCEHTFCYECLVKWCATKETCPLCRSKITELRETNRSLPNQRMVATFVCSCNNKWKSSFSYNGIKQGCKKCGAEVAASDHYPKTIIPSPAPSTFLGLFPFMRESSSHKQELCGMCRLLGRDCSRPETLGDDDDIFDIVGLESLMSLFNLSDSPFDQGHEDAWSFSLSDPEDYDIDWDCYDPIYCTDFGEDYNPFEDYEADWDDWDNVL